MARVQEQVLIIKVSKLVKDRDPENTNLVDNELVENAEAVLQQLFGDSVTVEVVADL